ncbi:MAG: transporter substrate-binding domain-containing protein [Gammaproteobacteria bacterium]
MSSARTILLFLLFVLFTGTCLGGKVAHPGNSPGLVLTAEEQRWVNAHPVIRVASDPDYAPFQFKNDAGESVGLANDYLEIISQNLGIRFEYRLPVSWAQALQLIKTHKADMVAVATETPERLKYMRFTAPYVAYPDVIITRAGEDVSSLEALHGKQLLTIKGFGVNEFLRNSHPQIELRMAADVMTLLQRVSTGEADAGLLNLATTSYAIEKWKITNLHISSLTEFSYKLALASRRDWPMLQHLLQKGVASIGSEERQAIYRKWVGLQSGSWKPTREQVIAFTVALTVAGFGVTLAWNRQLRRKVEFSTQELRASEEEARTAREAAEQATRAKTDFLAAASHDLRQPLHAMSLQIGQLKELLQDENAEGVLAQISNSQFALSDILNALLDISHLDAGTLKPNMTHFPLAQLFTRLENEFTSLAREHDVGLRLRSTRAWLYSDATLLYRVLANLVDNAIKHSRAPGVLIAARRRGDRWRIEVWDCGPGIPAEQQQAIFDKFVQLDNRGRDRRKGLGLGLSIVQRLNQLLGYQLRLISRMGRGTCFRLAVPEGVPLPRQNGAPLTHEERGYRLQGAVVLVVDDDPDVLAATRDLLTSWTCAVLTADSLEDAVRVAADEEIDVIIADYRLADGHTGLEVIETLNEKGGRRSKAVIITGDVNPEELSRLRGSRYPVLSKPVAPVTLRSLLHRLMVE